MNKVLCLFVALLGLALVVQGDQHASAKCGPENGISLQENLLDADIRQLLWVATKEIYIVTQNNTLYRSTDEGKSWENQLPHMAYSGEVQPLVNRRGVQYIFQAADDTSLYIFGFGYIMWTTTGDGKYTVYQSPHFIESIDPHPTEKQWAMATGYTDHCLDVALPGKCERGLLLTTDFGVSWTHVATYVYNWAWGEDKTVFYTTVPGANGDQFSYKASELRLMVSHDLGKTVDLELPYMDFLYRNGILYTVNEAEAGGLSLWISEDFGASFYKANFGFGDDAPTVENRYSILDNSEGATFIDVGSEDPRWGNTYYASTASGDFTLSLRKNKRTWYSTDFSRISGLDGIYLANQYEVAGDPKSVDLEQYVQSVITFDKGATWTRLPVPSNEECADPGCSLHVFESADQSGYASLYSSSNAVGLILATGNAGVFRQSRQSSLNTYFSRDAGQTWYMIRNGSYVYEFGDHGGLIVLADNQHPTNNIVYTWNDGITWNECQFSEQLINIENIRVEPTYTSRVFLVYGTVLRENGITAGVVIQVDFSQLDIPQCQGFDHPGTSTSDYELWTPGSGGCLLGQKVQYVRRKATSECYNGAMYETRQVIGACACTRQDYICDGDCFEEYTDTSGNVVCLNKCEGENDPTKPPAQCKKGETYIISQGYQKVVGDNCDETLPGAVNLSPVTHHCGESKNGGGSTALIVVCVVLALLVVLLIAFVVVAALFLFKTNPTFRRTVLEKLQSLKGSGDLDEESAGSGSYSVLGGNGGGLIDDDDDGTVGADLLIDNPKDFDAPSEILAPASGGFSTIKKEKPAAGLDYDPFADLDRD